MTKKYVASYIDNSRARNISKSIDRLKRLGFQDEIETQRMTSGGKDILFLISSKTPAYDRDKVITNKMFRDEYERISSQVICRNLGHNGTGVDGKPVGAAGFYQDLVDNGLINIYDAFYGTLDQIMAVAYALRINGIEMNTFEMHSKLHFAYDAKLTEGEVRKAFMSSSEGCNNYPFVKLHAM